MSTPNGRTNGKTRTAAAPADPWAGTEPTSPTASAAVAVVDAPAASPAPVQRQPGKYQRDELPPLPKYTLTSRKPTKVCTHPVLLVDGGEYSGKSRLAVELANDPRIGEAWMLSIGEEIDWLGAVADFEIVVHNGQWWQILSAVEQIHARFTALREAGELTPLLIVDSGSKLHELLSTWAEYRARASFDNRRRLLVDPNADINISTNYWNPANRRHRRLVHLLRSMPAIVVVTARGQMVTKFENGKPVEPAEKVYSVQANRELGFATTAWVRLAQGQYPQIIGARMAHGGVRPGEDEPLVIDPRLDRFADLRATGWTGFSLSWLVFDVLGFNPATAQPSQVVEPDADADPDEVPTGPASITGGDLSDADEAPGRDDGDELHPQQ